MAGHFLNELRESFAQNSGRYALEYTGRRWTYAELDAAARRCAAWLQSAGVNAGDRVVLFTPNKLPFLIGHLGAFYSGAIVLPLNPRFTREEMRFFLTDSGARIVLAGSEQRALIAELSAQLPQPPRVLSDAECLRAPPEEWSELFPGNDDPCLILYSSGTTGWPKGVVHTHSNIAHALHALASCWQMTSDDVVLNILPLFHIHGLAFATHLTWLTGGCLVVHDTFEPLQTLDAIARATVFMAVPPIYYKLLDEPQFAEAAKRWTKTRLFTCGSAPIRPEVLPQLEAILGKPVINRYGMTESYVISSLPLAGPWPYGSVGLPLAGVELSIIAENGSPVPPGEVGSVRIRGPNLFRQYWKKPEATTSAFAGGWFDTGDLGQLDAAGMLTLVGRQHDLIITSGYNVYPQVVERVVNECSGVAECAVLGLPDQQRGERVAVAIVRGDAMLNESQIQAWCKDRLVHYQQPKSIAFVDSLPRNSLGKVLRRELHRYF